MIEIEAYRNGTYPAANLPVEKIETETIVSADIVVLTEDVMAWHELGKRDILEKGQHFVIEDGIAYPFSTPFYPADEEENIDEQEFPETWEDVIGLIESFGR